MCLRGRCKIRFSKARFFGYRGRPAYRLVAHYLSGEAGEVQVSFFRRNADGSRGSSLGTLTRNFESEGIFRTEKIPVPTREEALRDLELLITSPTWKSLTWAKKGPCLPDPIREDQIIARMKSQAENIEPKPSNYEPGME